MNSFKQSYYAGLLIPLSMLLVSVNVYSQNIPDRGPIPFAAYDKNQDGVISSNEFKSARAERLAKRSAQGRPGPVSEPSFAMFDTNKDGRLSRAELKAGQQKQMQKRRGQGRGMGQGGGMGQGRGMNNMPTFASFDLNGDGKIVEKELIEARNKRISARAKQGFQMRNAGKSPLFSNLDLNKDGAISPKEFAQHQARRFSK